MAESSPEVCPFHGLPLMMELKKLTAANDSVEILMATCPKCKVIYIGQRVNHLSRFAYNGQQYQYLPKLANMQSKLKNEKYERIREDNERKRQKEKTLEFEMNRRKREQELKRESEKNKEERIRAEIKRLDDEIKNKKILEEREEAERKRQEEEHIRLEFEKERYRNFPFLQTGKIQIKTIGNKSNKCPEHSQVLGMLQFELQGENLKEMFSAFYCPQCNCFYLRKKRVKSLSINLLPNKQYKVKLTEKRWKRVMPLDVEKIEFTEHSQKIAAQDSTDKMENNKIIEEWKVDLNETAFKLIAYQKYRNEIAEIAAAVDGKDRYVRILTTVKEEDKRKCVPEDMLVREAETLGRELLGRIAHDQLDTFYAKGHEITIHHYKVWPGQEHHLDGFTKFVDPEKIQDITIMSQKNLARDAEEYEMVTALVYCANSREPVYIDVYYSKQKNKYFINEESYRQYSARYGLPYVCLVAGEYDGDMDYANLRQYSELNLYGYTVAKTADMSSAARQRLLQQLMDNGLMSKHQIINHLEWLIHRQSGRIRMEDACDCWREDLKFVNNYKINQQRKICGKFVYGKTALR